MLPQVLVITGPTASGKSALGESLALSFGGQIISADSRQVYRGLDLGSGKENLQVPQRLIDICDPGERFTAERWCERARLEIKDILAAGRLPIIVGGTNLYISGLLDDYGFAPEGDAELRAAIADEPTDVLVSELERTNADALVGLDVRNRRYLDRAVEKTRLGWRQPSKGKHPYDALVLVVDWPRPVLYDRIDKRLDDRLAAGLLDEVRGLLKEGVDSAWLINLGLEYRYLTDYLEGRYSSLDVAVERLKFASHHFARRQLMWWRHRPHQVVGRANLKLASKLVADWRRDGI